MFLGYPQGIKGYKVLDLTSNYVHISRNIILYEHIFPYALSSQPSTSYLDDFIFPHCTSDSSQSVGINTFPSSISIDPNIMPIAPSDAAPTAPGAAHGEAPGAAYGAAPPTSPNASSSAAHDAAPSASPSASPSAALNVAPNSAELDHVNLPLFHSTPSLSLLFTHYP